MSHFLMKVWASFKYFLRDMSHFLMKVWASFKYFLRDIKYSYLLVFHPGKLVYDFFNARWANYPIDAPRIAESSTFPSNRRVVVTNGLPLDSKEVSKALDLIGKDPAMKIEIV